MVFSLEWEKWKHTYYSFYPLPTFNTSPQFSLVPVYILMGLFPEYFLWGIFFFLEVKPDVMMLSEFHV